MRPDLRRHPQLVSITISSRVGKKYVAEFDDGKRVHFGANGYGDYIRYSRVDPLLANKKRMQYIARHGAMEQWNDPTTAATLARYILWEKPTMAESIRYYKRRFKV